jgi:hypothetical protein
LHQEKHPEVKKLLNTRQNKKKKLRERGAKMATQARENTGLGRVPLQSAMRVGDPPCGLSGSWPCGLDRLHADHYSG